MLNLELISHAVDFIEEHLKDPITVSDMAESVSYSLFHFCRTFNQAAHQTPYQYLMRRRLAVAAGELLRTERKIIDIALETQFNHPETFSRAFKSMFAKQPNQLRKEGCLDWRLVTPRLTLDHLRHIQSGRLSRPELVEKEPLSLTGLMAWIKQGVGLVSELHNQMDEEFLRGGLRSLGRLTYGVRWYIGAPGEAGYLYLAARQAEGGDLAGTALVSKTIPGGQYARFIHRGARQDLPLSLDYIYATWLPKSGKRLAAALFIQVSVQDLKEEAAAGDKIELLIPIR